MSDDRSQQKRREISTAAIAKYCCLIAGIEPVDSVDGSCNWWMFLNDAETFYDDIVRRFPAFSLTEVVPEPQKTPEDKAMTKPMDGHLESRVAQFQALELPGQPRGMHMGTLYLVNDLWKEVKKLQAALQLHAGDVMSLSNELDSWRERAQLAEAAINPSDTVSLTDVVPEPQKTR